MDKNDSEISESRRPRINKRLLIPKSFYFCFFAAYGSLLPYLALHFKQMLMNATQVGILMGLKPFINFVSIPVWGIIVDRYKLQRTVLLISMISLVLSCFCIVYIPSPEDTVRIFMEHCNRTDASFWNNLLSQRGIILNESNYNITHFQKTYKTSVIEDWSYAWPVEMATHFSAEKFEVNVDSTFTFVEIFLLLFFGTLIGSPSLALVDTATMKMLGTEAHKYGRQRLFGSLGWGIAAFLVGASLVTTHRCIIKHRIDIVDYSPCFYTYGIMMTLATIITFGFSFSKSAVTEIDSENTRDTDFSMKKGLEVISSATFLIFLVTSLVMGFQMSFIKTFLFWHLKDMGASTLLFSIISAVNGVAEVIMYLLSEKLIVCMGQQNVLFLGLLCYALRLFYYAFLTYPWLVLFAELLSGFTTAAAWAALLSYVNVNSKDGYKTTMQCILHSCHWGLGIILDFILGYGLGEVVGGILVHFLGAKISFIINGIVCLVNLVIYVLIVNKCTKSSRTEESSAEEEELEENDLRRLLEFKQTYRPPNDSVIVSSQLEPD